MDLLPRMLSLLLHYPDEELVREVNSLEEIVSGMDPPAAREQCLAFLDYLRRTPLIRVQEEYTGTFDLNPSTCLHLGHHKWGEDRERGSGLAALSALYHMAGFEMISGELPDHLPMVLEFLSICPEEMGAEIRREYREEVETLAGRLRDAGSPYAALLGLAVDHFHREHGT